MAAAASPIFDRLPYDLWEKIFANLCTGDRVRARLVCKSWRDILMRDNIPVAPEAPWLILSDDSFSKLEEVCFKSLHEERIYRFNLPGGEFRAGPGSRWRCCGSSGGWLLMAVWSEPCIRLMNMLLWNPISGAERQLPPPSTILFFSNIIIENAKGRISIFSPRLQVFSIGSVECVAALFEGGPGHRLQLAMCSTQDISWTVFENGEQYKYTDILFQKGKLHAMCVSDKNHELVYVNETKTIHLRGCDVEVDILSIEYEYKLPRRNLIQRWQTVERLVESPMGELLLVSAILDLHLRVMGKGSNVNVDCTETRRFEVRRVLGDEGRLEKLKGIGELGIFVGATSSLSLEASVCGVEANCIYFATDDAWGMVWLGTLCVLHEQGVFYLQEKKVRHSSMTVYSNKTDSIIGWFTPKLFQS